LTHVVPPHRALQGTSDIEKIALPSPL
jgi:hypothetical protein